MSPLRRRKRASAKMLAALQLTEGNMRVTLGSEWTHTGFRPFCLLWLSVVQDAIRAGGGTVKFPVAKMDRAA